MSAPESRREWFVRLDVECSTCARVDSAGIGSTSCEDARRNAMKILRYRGWVIAQRRRASDQCPKCSPPMPTCDLCGDPTPREYGMSYEYVTGVPFACPACWRKRFDEKRKEYRDARH